MGLENVVVTLSRGSLFRNRGFTLKGANGLTETKVPKVELEAFSDGCQQRGDVCVFKKHRLFLRCENLFGFGEAHSTVFSTILTRFKRLTVHWVKKGHPIQHVPFVV